jgi:hypothetical protein
MKTKPKGRQTLIREWTEWGGKQARYAGGKAFNIGKKVTQAGIGVGKRAAFGVTGQYDKELEKCHKQLEKLSAKLAAMQQNKANKSPKAKPTKKNKPKPKPKK